MDAFLLTLIRHGETSENLLKIMQGHRNTALSEKGIRQAELLGDRLRHDRFTHVFTSDLMRAKQTCQIIVDRNTTSSVNIVEDARLRERNVGIMEGRSTTEWRALIKSKKNHANHGIESKQKLHERAVGFFQQVILQQMRSLLIDRKRSVNVSPARPDPLRSSPKITSSKKRKHASSSSSIFDVDVVFPVDPTVSRSGNGSNSEDDYFDTTSLASPVAGHRVGQSLGSSVGPTSDERSSSSSSGCSSITTVCDWSIEENPAAPPEKIPTGKKCDNTAACTGTENMNVDVLSGVVPPWACPNVCLLPAVDRPLTRVSSVGSGRDVCFDDAENESNGGTFASVLVVTHGGFICELLAHFLHDLNCALPGRQNAVDRTTPNAAVSRFSIRILDGEIPGDFMSSTEFTDSPPGIPGSGKNPDDNCDDDDDDSWVPVHMSCLMLHDVDHLVHDPNVAPISTVDAY